MRHSLGLAWPPKRALIATLSAPRVPQAQHGVRRVARWPCRETRLSGHQNARSSHDPPKGLKDMSEKRLSTDSTSMVSCTYLHIALTMHQQPVKGSTYIAHSP